MQLPYLSSYSTAFEVPLANSCTVLSDTLNWVCLAVVRECSTESCSGHRHSAVSCGREVSFPDRLFSKPHPHLINEPLPFLILLAGESHHFSMPSKCPPTSSVSPPTTPCQQVSPTHLSMHILGITGPESLDVQTEVGVVKEVCPQKLLPLTITRTEHFSHKVPLPLHPIKKNSTPVFLAIIVLEHYMQQNPQLLGLHNYTSIALRIIGTQQQC